MGVVEPCGLGDPIAHQSVVTLDDLKDECLSSNRALIGMLQESEFSSELMAQAVADAKLGRMSLPVKGEFICECCF